VRDSRGRAREHAPASAPVCARASRAAVASPRARLEHPRVRNPAIFIDRSIDRSIARETVSRFRGVEFESDRRDRSIAPPSRSLGRGDANRLDATHRDARRRRARGERATTTRARERRERKER